MRGPRSACLAILLLAALPASAQQSGPEAQPVDPTRFGDAIEPKDAIGEPPVKMLKSREITPKADPSQAGINPNRFGEKPEDEAYGAFQRGLYKTAYNLALPRAEKGDGPAQALIAEIISRGLGVRVDNAAAAKWYERAAENNIPAAQFQYALMLLDGKYVKKDENAAFALMQEAAEAGNTLAQFNLAQLLVKRDADKDGMRKAVPYYRAAADSGLPDAQYAMSQILANGVGGVAKNETEARRWLTMAARQGYDTAQLDLGTWMVDGRGGEKDMTAGFNWLRRAAGAGNIAAMNRVAKLYMQGLGTDPDSIEAAAWYFLARRAGLNDFVMNDFLAGLTDEELKKALERANRLR